MFNLETHQLSADLVELLLWCNKCGAHVAHDLTATTDNRVQQTMAGTYRDENQITNITATCWAGHQHTIL